MTPSWSKYQNNDSMAAALEKGLLPYSYNKLKSQEKLTHPT